MAKKIKLTEQEEKDIALFPRYLYGAAEHDDEPWVSTFDKEDDAVGEGDGVVAIYKLEEVRRVTKKTVITRTKLA